MKSVSVLPTFVSQDADLKAKDSISAYDAAGEGKDFSSLVDKHLREDSGELTTKNSAEATQQSTAKNDKDIAANGKSGLEKTERQESDSQAEAAQNEENKQTTAVKVAVNESKKSESAQDLDNNESEALAESEQFISLLYNSDQTLNDANQQANKPNQKVAVDDSVEQVVAVSKASDTKSNKENSIVAASDEVTAKNKVPVTPEGNTAAEHKLKAFSSDELLKQSQLKVNNALSAHLSGQALKDYQASLQTKQSAVSSDSITSDQLLKSQLADKALNSKISDIAASVSQTNKSVLKENESTGLYQLPVEPSIKGKAIIDDPSLSSKTAVVSGELNNTANKVTASSDLADSAKVNIAQALTSSKGTSNTPEQVNTKPVNAEVKAEVKTSLDSEIQTIKVKNEKVTTESVLAAVSSNEKIIKEPTSQAISRHTELVNAQTQVLQQGQVQQKEQSLTNEKKAADENAYTESSLLAQDKIKVQPEQSNTKTIEGFNIRSAAEAHAQAIQTSQTKQNNDAYVEHQASEVLNHNVASDVAQIQKNNAQLQQETISIFKKDFADAVKDKVMVMINQKLQQFDITLDPPEFGNMQVRVNLQGEQAAVNFVVQNQQAKDALEQNMHKLRDMLSEQGVDVGGANVEQQSQQQDSEEGQSNKDGSSLAKQNAAEDNVEHILSAQLFDSSATGVDYYA